jgi:molecular chaperone GrpE
MTKKHKKDEQEKNREDMSPEAEDNNEGVQGEQGKPEEPGQSAAPVSKPEFVVVYTEEDVAELEEEIKKEKDKAEEYLQGWQRERAEFFNYKKRIERDQAQGSQNAVGSAIRRYLDIADDLSRALNNKNRPAEGEAAVWANGIDLIYRKFLAAFEADGVKMMATDGKYFDPNLHEAISHEDSPDHESGEIIEVVQPGYMLGDRVLRPARVRVAR